MSMSFSVRLNRNRYSGETTSGCGPRSGRSYRELLVQLREERVKVVAENPRRSHQPTLLGERVEVEVIGLNGQRGGHVVSNHHQPAQLLRRELAAVRLLLFKPD